MLERTEAPEVVEAKPVVLDPEVVGREERRWLEEVVERGEEAVRGVGRVREVGKLVVGLDYD